MGSTISIWGAPDARRAFDWIPVIVGESDRGAVLVSASVVDDYLRDLFVGVRPRSMSKRAFDRLAEYPGALSSLSGRADLAFATRLIGATAHLAVHHLRKLRNTAAHSPSEFRLADHLSEVRRVHQLGEGVPAFLNRAAGETLVQGVLQSLWEADLARPEGERLFKSPDDLVSAVLKRSHELDILREKAYRLELGLAVTLICAGIVSRRNTIIRAYPEDTLMGSGSAK